MLAVAAELAQVAAQVAAEPPAAAELLPHLAPQLVPHFLALPTKFPRRGCCVRLFVCVFLRLLGANLPYLTTLRLHGDQVGCLCG